ncbi:OmpA family protein [Pendulispora albinea]|uniref:OmpA family protein n=1 Tax=Pendulispora albinea TaxID=2741071 RepID=A0ABZ2MBE9_9BACT
MAAERPAGGAAERAPEGAAEGAPAASNADAPLTKIEGLSDGGMAARHPERRVHLRLAPSFEMDTTFNSVRAALTPIACWRLDSARFGFDSSFIHPDAREELGALAALCAELEGAPLSIFGHADSTNTDDYNEHLSGRRAEAAYALLTRRKDIWEHLYTSPYGGDDWKHHHVTDEMLRALGYEAPSRAEIERFQSEHGCPIDGDIGPETRGALFGAYMDFLCTAEEGGEPFRREASQFLGQGSSPDGKGDYQGCSDFNPAIVFSSEEEQRFKRAENKQKRDNANAPSRRVVAYLFRPGTVITVDRWPCPSTKEGAAACKKRFWSDAEARRKPGAERRTFPQHRDTFACRFYHGLAMRSPCERLAGCNRVVFRLQDHWGYPMVGQPCLLIVEGAYRETISKADGLVDTTMPDGPYKVAIAEDRFAYFGEGYTAYQNDPVEEMKTAPEPCAHAFAHTRDARFQSAPLDQLLAELERLEKNHG